MMRLSNRFTLLNWDGGITSETCMLNVRSSLEMSDVVQEEVDDDDSGSSLGVWCLASIPS